MQYLVNQFGRVREIHDDSFAEELVNSGRMRVARQDEIDKHNQHRSQKVAERAKAKGTGIYYSTIKRSPDGYGMSRDILKNELFAQGIYLSENYSQQKVGLLYNYPYGIKQMRNDVRLIYTMFESDQIPEDWPEYLEEANEVLVPSTWCQKVFAKSGIKTTVVPLGYNSDVFTYHDRKVPVEEDGVFTFIHYDSFNIRKGFMEIIEAFSKEFDPAEPVRLILKTIRESSPIPIIPSEYPNIEVVRGQLSEVELWELLCRANCMVYPSRGEGFGITPLEAMATGLPAIIPNAHGISEYFNPDYMLEVKIGHMEPGLYNRFKGQNVGDMTVVDVADLRKQMRYAFNNQRAMKIMGRNASEYVKKFTYKKTAERLAEILKKWEEADIQKRPESKFLDVEVF